MTSVPLFQVETCGLLTTVQELAGAVDTFAASVANILVGNPRGVPLLEMTLIGPTLRVLSDVRIAVCGADLSAAVDGVSLPLWKTLTLRTGQQVTISRRRSGARAYLAIAGGGCQSQRLHAGAFLEGNVATIAPHERGLWPADMPDYRLPALLRLVPGPHIAAFTESVWEVVSSSAYLVTPQANRMGYRLSGPPIERLDAHDILSEAMPFGGLQVPPDGQPILLMADRQTTGGYPLLGTVISVDLPRAAQLAPGDGVQFEAITLTKAQECAIQQERWLRVLEA